MFSRKDLIKLIIPLIIEQTLAVTVGLVDSMMVANVGEAAVSGVSLVDSINFLLFGLFGALATGGAVVAAQFLGHKDVKSARTAGEQLFVSIMVLSIVLMILTILFGNGTLKLLYGKVEADVMVNARIYLFYSALSFPFLALYNACAALFRTMGNSKVSMYISICLNILHIILNFILIFGLGMGVAGAAISTLISRIYAAMNLYFLLKNKRYPLFIDKIRNIKMNPYMIKRILRIGVPNGLENSVFQIGKILVQRIASGLGTSALTANAVAGTFANFGVLPGNAIGLALITVVGQCMGAGDYPGIKLYTRKLMKYTYLSMIIVNILIIFVLPRILPIFGLTEVTEGLSTQLIIYHCLLCSLIWPLAFVLPNALRATNDVKFTMWISIFSMWSWRIAFSYVLAIILHMGILGIWIAMTIDWIFRSLCFTLRFKKEKYKAIKDRLTNGD